ncbi:formin-binding protein 4-like [Cydia strobilella]|uniref:formin-binding protein 4-like n=1 Tax=Cydia strobilella TaxID=1100964 RepID=UPI00300525AB
MQDTQTDPENCRRLGVDEQFIKFRPSPNFKNMKKFLKYKIDCSESSSQSPPNGNCEQPNTSESPPSNSQPMEKEEQPSPVKPVVHPPLPLEPPPPDKLPVMPVPIKNEFIENDYPDQESGQESPNLSTAELSTAELSTAELSTAELSTAELSTAELSAAETEESSLRLNEEHDSQAAETPKVTVCRDFIRGTCVRVGCRYAHQRDLSQLMGVYTFCRNYQNKVCTLPLCKYVHASVFEEQEFYRTGVLPPRAQYHLKKPFYMLPPPPPPPLPEVNSSPPCTPEVLNAVALRRNPSEKPLISCVPVSKLESKPAENDFRHMIQAITSPLKRDWNSIDPFTSPPRDLDHKQLFTKKCKHCDSTDIRLQYNKEKLEAIEKTSKELKMKSKLLTQKSQNLITILLTVIKEQAESVNGYNKLKARLNMCGEKEREVLQNIIENHNTQVRSNIM